MTRLSWDKSGERVFELGVEKGVFYPQVGIGVPWNGLISVNETPDGGEPTPYYLDGIKFLNVPNPEDFAGSIEAFNYPKEFAKCDGMAAIGSVLYIGQQPRKTFGLAYKTKVGNDTQGQDALYKLHLVYNCLVSPTNKNYDTISDSVDPVRFTWNFTTTPLDISGLKPSAHMVIESSNSEFILALEDILYGTALTNPSLPEPNAIIDLLASL